MSEALKKKTQSNKQKPKKNIHSKLSKTKHLVQFFSYKQLKTGRVAGEYDDLHGH